MTYVQRHGAIVWAVSPSEVSDDIIDAILAELVAQLARDTPYVLIFDLTHAGVPNALHRRKLAAHIRDNTPRIRRCVRGVGVILTSPLVRGIVTAIFWIARPPVPYQLFASRADAPRWADSLGPDTPAPEP
jgi:hypothetical protein